MWSSARGRNRKLLRQIYDDTDAATKCFSFWLPVHSVVTNGDNTIHHYNARLDPSVTKYLLTIMSARGEKLVSMVIVFQQKMTTAPLRTTLGKKIPIIMALVLPQYPPRQILQDLPYADDVRSSISVSAVVDVPYDTPVTSVSWSVDNRCDIADSGALVTSIIC